MDNSIYSGRNNNFNSIIEVSLWNHLKEKPTIFIFQSSHYYLIEITPRLEQFKISGTQV
jgi:hypothetical protein